MMAGNGTPNVHFSQMPPGLGITTAEAVWRLGWDSEHGSKLQHCQFKRKVVL